MYLGCTIKLSWWWSCRIGLSIKSAGNFCLIFRSVLRIFLSKELVGSFCNCSTFSIAKFMKICSSVHNDYSSPFALFHYHNNFFSVLIWHINAGVMFTSRSHIDHYNVIINEKNDQPIIFYDQPIDPDIKQHEEIKKLATG